MLVAGEEKYLLGKDGFQSAKHSLYSTQLFDAELDLLVMYSREFCRLGFRCLLLTSSHTYKSPSCLDYYRTDMMVHLKH